MSTSPTPPWKKASTSPIRWPLTGSSRKRHATPPCHGLSSLLTVSLIQISELIARANAEWDARNLRAVEEGEPELPRQLPLVRLKVETTGASELANPHRFGQEFQGQVANPRDVLVFHRARKAAGKGKSRVKIDEPELSIDDPDLSAGEKLSKVRVQTLVREYLGAQELQLLGDAGMFDAIELFVDKDDIHAIEGCVCLGPSSESRVDSEM